MANVKAFSWKKLKCFSFGKWKNIKEDSRIFDFPNDPKYYCKKYSFIKCNFCWNWVNVNSTHIFTWTFLELPFLFYKNKKSNYNITFFTNPKNLVKISVKNCDFIPQIEIFCPTFRRIIPRIKIFCPTFRRIFYKTWKYCTFPKQKTKKQDF